jgi:GntR family transcriptional regulator/MocR family aminotransferase
VGPDVVREDDDLGLVWLRSMLAVRAGLTRNDVPGADQLIVTAGVQAAIAAVARTWLGPGRIGAVAPGYPSSTHAALEATGARIVRLDLADDGRRLGPPVGATDLILVAPSVAGPDDGPLTPAARRRLIEWATRVGAIVVEDDRERDVRTDRSPTLASLDTDGRVIGVGGIPAELAPGASLGYLVVPPALHGPVAAMVLAGGQAPGLVEQEALASMLESGDFERELRRLREAWAAALTARRADAHVGAAAPVSEGRRMTATGSAPRWSGGVHPMRLRDRP